MRTPLDTQAGNKEIDLHVRLYYLHPGIVEGETRDEHVKDDLDFVD
jgi:hypothetical protein